MNKFDKQLLRALNYFANNSLVEIERIKNADSKKYREFIPENIEEYAFSEGYIDADTRKVYGITPQGLEQLRNLEGIKLNQRSFWLSILALIISIGAVVISYINRGGR